MVVDVASTEGIDKVPGRLSCCLSGSGADGGWVLVDGTDMCNPNVPTSGPGPLVVCAATLVIEVVAETLGWGAVVGAFASLETEGPCTLAPFTG